MKGIYEIFGDDVVDSNLVSMVGTIVKESNYVHKVEVSPKFGLVYWVNDDSNGRTLSGPINAALSIFIGKFSYCLKGVTQ